MNAKETADELTRLRNLATVLYDENKQLRVRVAELEAEARWVSVTERLPEPEYTKWCIVQDILRGVYPAYFRDGLWWSSRENERCGIDIEGVILWRKFPKAIKFPEADNE